MVDSEKRSCMRADMQSLQMRIRYLAKQGCIQMPLWAAIHIAAIAKQGRETEASFSG